MNDTPVMKEAPVFRVKISDLALFWGWLFFLFLPAVFLRIGMEELVTREEVIRHVNVKKQLAEEKNEFINDLHYSEFFRQRLQLVHQSFPFSFDEDGIFSQLQEKVASATSSRVQACAVWFGNTGNIRVWLNGSDQFRGQECRGAEQQAWVELMFLLGSSAFENSHKLSPGLRDLLASLRGLQGQFQHLLYNVPRDQAYPVFCSTALSEDVLWTYWNEAVNPQTHVPVKYWVALSQNSLTFPPVMNHAMQQGKNSSFQRIMEEGPSSSGPISQEKGGELKQMDFLPRHLVEPYQHAFGRTSNLPVIVVKASRELIQHPIRSWFPQIFCILGIMVAGGALLALHVSLKGGILPVNITGKIVLGIIVGIWVPAAGFLYIDSFSSQIQSWNLEQETLDQMDRRLEQMEKLILGKDSSMSMITIQQEKALQKMLWQPPMLLQEFLRRRIKPLATSYALYRADGKDFMTQGLEKETHDARLGVGRAVALEVLLNTGAVDAWVKNGQDIMKMQNFVNFFMDASEDFIDWDFYDHLIMHSGVYEFVPFSAVFQKFAFLKIFPSGSRVPQAILLFNKVVERDFRDFLSSFEGKPGFASETVPGFRLQFAYVFAGRKDFATGLQDQKWVPHLLPAAQGERPTPTRDDTVFRRLANLSWAGRLNLRVNEMSGSTPYLAVTRAFRDLPFVGVARAIPEKSPGVFAWVRLIFILGGVFAALVAIALGTSTLLFRPLEACVKAIQATSSGNLGWKLEVATGDEVEQMADALNTMVVGVAQREKMKRFVSEDVVEAVQTDSGESLQPGGERKLMTILFSHIHGFGDLLYQHSSEEITALLNAYFTRMDGCIRLSHGRLDKFIGDAIMAVFRDEGPDRRQAQNACRAALAMRREVERFNRKRAAQGLFQVETGIGIASGSVISGRIGSRHGRLDFTVIGDPVNLAARVEAESVKGRKTRILLAPSTIRLLKGQGRLEFLGRLPLKGKSRSFSLYELLGMR